MDRAFLLYRGGASRIISRLLWISKPGDGQFPVDVRKTAEPSADALWNVQPTGWRAYPPELQRAVLFTGTTIGIRSAARRIIKF